MNFRNLLLILFVIIFANCSRKIQVIQGHAHNDYLHKLPLKEALNHGFISVEVDVHLVNDNLYVSHDTPYELNPELTLESLYLNPLKAHVSKHNGFVYPNYTGPFYLMIDFKTAAQPSYHKLKTILNNYQSVIKVIDNGIERKGPVTIFISGNRPILEILEDELKLVGLDGRPDDLEMNIPASIMPVVSDNYYKVLSWTGEGGIKDSEHNRLMKLIQDTHRQNKKLRLWAAPDNAKVWKYLLDQGVDLINTDHLQEFKGFMLNYNTSIKR